MKCYYLLLLFFCWHFVHAQNLVPNGDFEQYDTCQTGLGQLYRARFWESPISPLVVSSPDYFNACNPNPLFSAPTNAGGYEHAHSGIGYSAICTGAKSGAITGISGNFREYLQVELLDTLVAGGVYCLQFFVSACDSMSFTSDNIGVYFSSQSIHDTCEVGGCALPYVPQFENPLSNSLSNNYGWTKVYGTFTAQGGEKFLVIGNFRDSSNTQMVITNWTANPNRNFAVYYVDDVSLTFCDTNTSILDKRIKSPSYIYPNPSTGIFYVELEIDIVVDLQIFDATSNLVYQEPNYSGRDSPVNISNLADGIYLIKISNGADSQLIKILKRQ